MLHIHLNIVKMSVLPSLICRFNAVPMEVPTSCLVDTNELILEFIWRGERPKTAHTILKERNKVRGLTHPDVKISYEATVTESVVLVK